MTIIEVGVIYNFIIALFFVTSAFLLGIYLKSKIIPPNKKQKIINERENITADKATNPLSTKYQAASSRLNPDYKDIMETAQNQAKTLLQQTANAAAQIITGTKKTNEHIEEEMDHILSQIAASDIRSLKETTENFDKDYKKVLLHLESELQKLSLEIVEQTKKQYSEMLDEFIKTLTKTGTTTQNIVDKKTAELISLAEADIAEYKKQQFANIDEKIRKLIQRVYRDVLRVSIPENLQQDLIIKSLEEAKKDELFKS